MVSCEFRGHLHQHACSAKVAGPAQQLWIDATGVTTLPPLQVTVADLSGNQLGSTIGNVITLDVDAAGVGWFIDTTPDDAVEFDPALGNTAALGRYDLLTAAAHEVGHALGYVHSDQQDVMTETLPVGTRRLPMEDHNGADSTLINTDEHDAVLATVTDPAPVFLLDVFDEERDLILPELSIDTQPLSDDDLFRLLAVEDSDAIDAVFAGFTNEPDAAVTERDVQRLESDDLFRLLGEESQDPSLLFADLNDPLLEELLAV